MHHYTDKDLKTSLVREVQKLMKTTCRKGISHALDLFSACPCRGSSFLAIASLSVVLSLSVSLQAGTFSSNFTTDPGGTLIGAAVVEDGILKLVDLNDLNDGTGNLPRHGSYILPDFNNGAIIGSFNAKFKARMGGGTERAAQGFSLVLANDLATDVPFREAGGTADGGGFTSGLVISFDTIDNLGVFGANGNDPGDAPGVIIRIGGTKVAARRATNLLTDAPAANNIGTPRFVDVEVNLDPDGTLDVTYDGVKIYDNVGIGYAPIAGVFGFGAGTAELTAALRNNHWIDDVNITATAVSGSYVSSKAPVSQGARADSAVVITLENLSSQTVQLTLDGVAVTPTVTQQGATTTVTYRPTQLFASDAKHTVALTYDGKSFTYEFTVVAYSTIPATAKVPAGSVDTSSSGFKARTYQVVAPPPSNISTAEKQLAGLSGPNIANLTGAGADGRFNLDVVNYSDDGTAAGNISAPAETVAPGIPGTTPDGNESADNYVVESIAYLDLPQGYIVLGVASDDGFQVSIGQDPRDATATVVGIVNGVANTTFGFVVAEAGIYGVRVLHYEIGGAGHCEFFSLTGDGNRILINDRATAGHVKAYRDRSATFKAPPYVTSAKPAPGESNVSTRPSVEVVITEEATTLNAASIQLKINNQTVAHAAAKQGKQTTVTYRPPVHLAGEASQTIALSYTDDAGNNYATSWAFSTAKSPCDTGVSGPRVTGYWNFDDGSLKASVGSDITYIDNALASHYSFGTSGQGAFADIPGIGGKPVKFLSIPRNENGEDFKKTGIRVKTGLAASGGGTKANVWTMIADIYWGEGHAFGTLFRSHDLDGNNDGDLFWRASDGGYGKGCCSLYDGVDPAHNFPRNAWGRLVLVGDLTSSPRKFAKYYNGFKHREDLSGDGDAIDSRFALPSDIFMFNDGDDNEQSTAHVSAIQFREGALTDEEVVALGGPSADGIPVPTGGASPAGVAGQWDFDGNLNATVGAAVHYLDDAIASHYSFGTSGQGAFADVPGINGQPVQFLAIPRNENDQDFKKTGIRVPTGLQPSGGGTKANVWTMVVDVYWGEGHAFGTILRTHDLDGNNDGDLFWSSADGGYGKGCCSLYVGVDPAHRIERNTWGRLVLVSDLTASPRKFAKYYNGFKHREDLSGDGDAIDSRFALPSEIIMFNDGDDNEQSTAYVSSIQIRPVALTDEEVAALGGPSADGIPQPQTVSPSIKGNWEFNGDLKATIGSDVAYIDNALSSHYSFGTTGQGAFADVPAINGEPAQFLAIPRNENGEDFKKTGIRVKTGLAASGGGTKANVWTMVADIYWGEGHAFGTLFRSHDLDGNNDGDLFWRASDGGYGKGCCSLYDGVDPAHNFPRNAWGRLVLVADLTSSPRKFAKYYNGFKHREDLSGDGDAIDSRFALPAEILMFNDGDDNEQSTAYISSLQFRDVALTGEEVAALGGPSAGGIPITGAANDCGQTPPPSEQPKLTVSRSGGNIVISWTGTGFVLESADALGSAWTAVPGVTGNSATIPITGFSKFYRLRK